MIKLTKGMKVKRIHRTNCLGFVKGKIYKISKVNSNGRFRVKVNKEEMSVDYYLGDGYFKLVGGKKMAKKKNPKFIVEWEEEDSGDPIEYCYTEPEVTKKVLELAKDDNVIQTSIKVHSVSRTVVPKITVVLPKI